MFTSACSRYAEVKSVKGSYNVGDGCVSLTLSLDSWGEDLATQGARIENIENALGTLRYLCTACQRY